MATVEDQSASSALLHVEGTELKQELPKVTKDVEAETPSTEETVAEKPNEELELTTESLNEVQAVQETETPKHLESKEVDEVHDSKTPKEEEVEEVVELQKEENPKEKESHEDLEVQEAEITKEEEYKELVEKDEPTSEETAAKIDVQAVDAMAEVGIEGSIVNTEKPAVVSVEESKEAVFEDKKNEDASNEEAVANNV